MNKKLHNYVPFTYTPRKITFSERAKTMPLFEHDFFHHSPKNINDIHTQEQSFNQRLAVSITKATGTMFCAYIFAFLAILGFPLLSNWFGPIISIYVVWLSQTFIQLTMLPILSVGQNVLGRKAELQADETYTTTIKGYHDLEQIMQHLSAQDEEILKHTELLLEITKKIEQQHV